MTITPEIEAKPISRSLILITLMLSSLASMISGMLSGLQLIDIGETFNVTVAIAGQILTFSFVISVIFALLTSILTLRYNHKLLLQIGLAAYVVSAIGCYMAPNFTTMIASYSLTGIGYALTTTMAFTLAADLFPVEKRGAVIGWIVAGQSGSYLVGAFVVPFLQSIGGWRSTFIGYMFPISGLALVLATTSIPRNVHGSQTSSQRGLKESFKEVFSNRSAISSLVGLLFAMAAWQAVMAYFGSFFREWFNMTINETSILILFGATLYTLGSIASGRMMNRIGRKPLTVVPILIAGITIITYSRLPNVILSGGFLCVSCLLVGMMDAASTSFIVEQLPAYTGVMMSLSRAVNQVGFSIGSGLGGVFLLLYGYQDMFLLLGTLAIASALVFRFFTIDPSSK
jgi:predicted MFS family arabinose efflux permease